MFKGQNSSPFVVCGNFLMGTIVDTFKLSGTFPICKELLIKYIKGNMGGFEA